MRLHLASLLLLAGSISLAHADAPVRYVTGIPFQDCEGLICFPVDLGGGQQITMALDTGNVHSYIAEEAAKPAGWTLEPAMGRDGKPIEGLSKSGPHTLTLGSVPLDGKLLVFPLKDLGPKTPPFMGGIDFTLLKDRVVQIDYVHHILRLSAPLDDHDASTLPGTLKTITFGTRGPAILTGGPFTVNGRRVWAQIDTCYTGSLLIYDAAVPKLGMKEIADKGAARMFPYTDGGVNMLEMPAQSLGFAGHVFKLPQPSIYFATPEVHQPDGLFEATVGNALFAGSVLTLDLHHMRFDVQPAG